MTPLKTTIPPPVPRDLEKTRCPSLGVPLEGDPPNFVSLQEGEPLQYPNRSTDAVAASLGLEEGVGSGLGLLHGFGRGLLLRGSHLPSNSCGGEWVGGIMSIYLQVLTA